MNEEVSAVVVDEGVRSRQFEVVVHQGSMLSPLLFIGVIYVLTGIM